MCVIIKAIHRVFSEAAKTEPPSINSGSPFPFFPTALSTPLQGSLFEIAPSSHISDLIDFASSLANFRPKLLESIAVDLSTDALTKKQQRIDERRWLEAQTETMIDVPANEPKPLQLEVGRPRIQPLCVLAFLLLRGWIGRGFKEGHAQTMITESISLRNFMENMGQRLPAASTIEENLKAISNKALKEIHLAQLALARNEKLDDFKKIRGDSTATDSASAYPIDSATIAKLLVRLCNDLGKLNRFGLTRCSLSEELTSWQAELEQLKYRIGTLTSSSANQAEEAERKESEKTQVTDNQLSEENKESAKQKLQRELYERLYVLGEEILPELEKQYALVNEQIRNEQCSPKRQRRRETFIDGFKANLEASKQAIIQSKRRVCEGKKPSAAGKMPLSVSDMSAKFILKGGWDKTFGYRPQLSFSESNLVTALIVPEGNAADQGQYIPLVKVTIANTGVVPAVFSTDDGYTGAEQFAECLALGVKIVSFSGARGKALLGAEKWDSEPYKEARKARNGAESGIGVLKAVERFGQLATCGIENVRGELLGKVISYNALKIVSLRKRKYENESGKKWKAGLPEGMQETA